MTRAKKTRRAFQKRGSIAVSVCWAQNEVGSAENGTNIFPKSHPEPCQEKQLGTLKTFYTCYIHILWKSSKSDLFVNNYIIVIFYLFCWFFPAGFAEILCNSLASVSFEEICGFVESLSRLVVTRVPTTLPGIQSRWIASPRNYLYFSREPALRVVSH